MYGCCDNSEELVSKEMAILFLYCFCLAAAFFAISNDLINNLAFVLLSISIGSCLAFIVRQCKLKQTNWLYYISYAFYIIPVIICPAFNIDDNFLFFMYGVIGIWALIFINIDLINKISKTLVRLKILGN